MDTDAPTSVGALSLEARIEIGELIAEHAWLIDHGQADRLPRLYVELCAHYGAGEDLIGIEALRAWSIRRAAMTARTSRHVCTNIRLVDEGHGRAAGTVLVTLFRHDRPTAGAPVPFAVGEYDDRYVSCPDGRWRFESRRFSIVFGP